MLTAPEQYRVRTGPLASDATYGANGMFAAIGSPEPGWQLLLILSDEGGWEHVSVQAVNTKGKHRIPTWKEMVYIKDLCWDAEDVVMELHPKHSQYVNFHPFVLHLWRPNDGREIPTPPAEFVGPLS